MRPAPPRPRCGPSPSAARNLLRHGGRGQARQLHPPRGNVGLSYIRSGLTLRAQLNHTGERLTSYNVNPAQWQFLEQRAFLDVSVKYAVSPRLGFFVDVFNVNNAKYLKYQGLGTRPVDCQYYGTRLSSGITGRF